jgi:hypothetical protein
VEDVGTIDCSPGQGERSGSINWKLSMQHSSLASISSRPRTVRSPTRLRILAIPTKPALQSVGRRRNMLGAQCSAALNQQKTIATAGRAKRGRIEFPIVNPRPAYFLAVSTPVQ